MPKSSLTYFFVYGCTNLVLDLDLVPGSTFPNQVLIRKKSSFESFLLSASASGMVGSHLDTHTRTQSAPVVWYWPSTTGRV
jgi:hypothetical protein